MHLPDWHCPTCGRFSILGGEVSESNYDKQQQRIKEHTALHDTQLAEHDGDHEALKFRLRFPGVHHAIQKVKASQEVKTQ
ncbi:MAG: hypothetical protein J2P17_00790 [Mycobacterium sp.]|nr:hypothetical protein [Mycobacterium sp.]